MGVSIGTGGFSTREEAKSIIDSEGLFARDGAMQSGDLEDVHWHKTSLKIYVLTGKFETRDVVSLGVLSLRLMLLGSNPKMRRKISNRNCWRNCQSLNARDSVCRYVVLAITFCAMRSMAA
jgi:hypothetical protein